MQPNEGVLLEPKRVLTPVARISWAYLLEPDNPKEDNKKPMYRMSMLFPKGTDMTPLYEAAGTAVKEKWGNKRPNNLNSPFHDGNSKIDDNSDPNDIEAYKNTIMINVKSSERPRVGCKINGKFVEIDDPNKIYNGMWCRATIKASAYSNRGNQGVSFWLDDVCKTDDDKKINQRRNTDADFNAVPDSSFTSVSAERDSVSEDEYTKYFDKDSGIPDFLRESDDDDTGRPPF